MDGSVYVFCSRMLCVSVWICFMSVMSLRIVPKWVVQWMLISVVLPV